MLRSLECRGMLTSRKAAAQALKKAAARNYRNLDEHDFDYDSTLDKPGMSYSKNFCNTFPVKLFDLVTSEDPSVVCWKDSGDEFQVKDLDKFINIVLPKHFKRESINDVYYMSYL